RRQKAKAAAAGKRRAPAALPSPASSSEDEAPEEVPFGVAREAAEAERQLVGEAARRHRELLKEKRRRHQELFAEQKVPRCPRRAAGGHGCLRRRCPCPPDSPLPRRSAGCCPRPCCRSCRSCRMCPHGEGARGGGSGTKGNYMAVCLKDHSATGLHQQLARDFINAQLYGPHTNRVQANEFFSLANKKDPVKKAAVQFVDKSWGQDKKEKAARFKKRWLA
ncbi:NOL7 protein, partial [Dyaphorophyia castanea]|nr:NOL7 protein [Platysteira castanea]